MFNVTTFYGNIMYLIGEKSSLIKFDPVSRKCPHSRHLPMRYKTEKFAFGFSAQSTDEPTQPPPTTTLPANSGKQ